MKEIALEEEIRRSQKEQNLIGAETDRRFLEMRIEMDHLKLELAALKSFLATSNPSFAEQYPRILAQTIMEVDPESH